MSRRKVNRRDFIATSGAAAASAMIVPRHVLGGQGFTAPSDLANIAVVGAGGMGASNTTQILSENLIAVADVDFDYVDRRVGPAVNRDGTPNKLHQAHAKARRYADFREMLDKEKGIDGVIIATPDHTHAAVAKAAMELKKAVYVQKPLCATVAEARMLAKLAASSGVVTQMGNQGHSREDTRLIREWIQAGLIGAVKEVHIYTDRPLGYWPQAVPRPIAEGAKMPPMPAPGSQWSQGTINNILANGMSANVVKPDSLNWDLYLGPVPEIPYHPIYHPFTWRGWLDFGGGALGDMGAHLVDGPFYALGLDYPTTVEGSSTPFGGPRTNPASFPMATNVQWEFAATPTRPAFKMYWYDGGLMAPRPAALPDDFKYVTEGGVFIVGEKGVLVHQTYGAKPQLFPAALMEEAKKVPKTERRVTTTHEMNWVNAIKGTDVTSSPIEYAAKLVETMHLGVAAVRHAAALNSGPQKLQYDGAKMAFTNQVGANQYLTRPYRAGWNIV
ncbi:MAG: Gfo/Idh/MocA family oxidoreductase [Gemmatimonadales bacterium]